ncbi:hypothetical protein BHE74_00030203 [Ensete ventricosum]|nr:hypothetical protein BHE74_00030203 [Ensete ventricosum]
MNQRNRTIGCRSRDWFGPDRKSDFATEQMQQSGSPHELPQPNVPVCASSLAVVSVERRWSTVEWREPLGAFIMGAIGRSYLRSLMPLRVTILSYFFTPSVVLGVRRAFYLL